MDNSVFQARWLLIPLVGLFICITAAGALSL